jgi:hypothetical protein
MHTEPAQAAGSSQQRPAGEPCETSFLRANAITLVAGILAVALAGIIWLGLPHEREIDSIWVFLLKLTPFAAASVAIAWLDTGWAHRLRLPLVLIPGCFLTFFCLFVPRMFYYRSNPGPEHYYTVLTLVPFIILALALAYRLGGGSRPTTLRLCAALIVLQLSGVEDLAFLVTYAEGGWRTIPEMWDWAHHMRVRIGHFPSRAEAFAFIAAHVTFALALLIVPGRAVRGMAARLRMRREERR